MCCEFMCCGSRSNITIIELVQIDSGEGIKKDGKSALGRECHLFVVVLSVFPVLEIYTLCRTYDTSYFFEIILVRHKSSITYSLYFPEKRRS